MKRIVSYSFFRSDASIYEQERWSTTKRGQQFVQFLPMLIRAHYAIWPYWTIRIHHDDRVVELPYFRALEKMNEVGLVELRFFGKSDSICGANGMLARLRPIFDEDVEYVACRDVDSVPMPRDRRCVEEFIGSGRVLHGINDHEQHSGLMGGLTTIHAPKFRAVVGVDSVEALMAKYGHDIDFTKHGSDQDLLNRFALFAFTANDTMTHELHHVAGAIPSEIRTQIGADVPSDIDATTAKIGDSFSAMLGGCVEPIPPFKYYNQDTFRKNRDITACELRAGIASADMMEAIAKL